MGCLNEVICGSTTMAACPAQAAAIAQPQESPASKSSIIWESPGVGPQW